jgi:hypothetical protein
MLKEILVQIQFFQQLHQLVEVVELMVLVLVVLVVHLVVQEEVQIILDLVQEEQEIHHQQVHHKEVMVVLEIKILPLLGEVEEVVLLLLEALEHLQ